MMRRYRKALCGRKVKPKANVVKEVREIKKLILKENKIMAQSREELKSAIAAISEAVKADVEQDKEVVRVVKILIDKLATAPNADDFTEEVAAVAAATGELAGDNADVKTALDGAGV